MGSKSLWGLCASGCVSLDSIAVFDHSYCNSRYCPLHYMINDVLLFYTEYIVVDICHNNMDSCECELVWPSSKALGW